MPGIPLQKPLDQFTLPLVDFKHYSRSREDAEAIGRDLYLACRDVGFAYLINTSIPQDAVKGMFDWSAKFFALPQEVKEKAPHPPEGYKHRGYSGVGKEQVSQMVFDPDKLQEIRAGKGADLKESFDMGNEKDAWVENVWLPDAELPGFRDYAVKFWQTCRAFESDLLDALSLGLPGVPEGFLQQYHADGHNQLRLLHYPSAPCETFTSGDKGRIGAHTDFGTCTLLFQDDCGGLEVEDPFRPGTYIPAPPVAGSIVFNIGDFMMRWSNDTLKSTLHRVRAPPPKEGDVFTRERFSIPYFISADKDKVIDALPGSFGPERPKKYEPVTSGEYLARRLNATYVGA